MGWSLDQANVGAVTDVTGAITSTLTTGATVASKAWIFIALSLNRSSNLTVVATGFSGGGLTWTLEGDHGVGHGYAALFRAYAPTGLASGTVLTLTFSAAGYDANGMVASSYLGGFPDSALNGPIVMNDNNLGFVTPWTSGPITTTETECLIISAASGWDGVSSTPTAPSVEDNDNVDSVSRIPAIIERRIETNVGTYTNAGTWASAADLTVVSGAYTCSKPKYDDYRRFPKFLLVR